MNPNDTAARMLLTKYSAAGSPDGAEQLLLKTLGEDKQQIVLNRLAVIDRYLSQADPSLAYVEEAAASLGMGRRNFYRLVAKLGELGAVRGLAPKFRNKVSTHPSNAGLSEVAEEEAQAFVRGERQVSVNEFVEAAIKRSRDAGEKAPTPSTIRRRLNALVRAGYAVKPGGRVGRNIVIDQVIADLPVKFSRNLQRPIVTFILDRETTLILGIGVGLPDFSGTSLAMALRDMARGRVAELAQIDGVMFAEFTERVDWIVDMGLEGHVGRVRELSAELNPVLDLQIHTSGTSARRRGLLLTKLIGTGLGSIQFVKLPSDATREFGDVAPIEAWEATRNLGLEATMWNMKAIERLRNSGSAGSDEAPDASRKLIDTVAGLFDWEDA